MATPRKPNGPSLRFRYPEALHRKLLKVLAALEAAEDPTEHRDALAELVVALTDRGLAAYFLEPLEAAGAGFLTRQSANLGVAGAERVMGPLIRNLLSRMDGPQLLSVAGSIRGFMVL